jgi:hypothetical protein
MVGVKTICLRPPHPRQIVQVPRVKLEVILLQLTCIVRHATSTKQAKHFAILFQEFVILLQMVNCHETVSWLSGRVHCHVHATMLALTYTDFSPILQVFFSIL